MAVTAGKVTLGKLDAESYERLEALGLRLEHGLREAIRQLKVKACVQRVGSMITLFFHEGPVRSWDEAARCDTSSFANWHQQMLKQGIYWPPAQYEAAFISVAHSESDIDRTISAARTALQKL